MDYKTEKQPGKSFPNEDEYHLTSLFLPKLKLSFKSSLANNKNGRSELKDNREEFPKTEKINENDIEKLREDFLNTTSHELNTPLTSLKIFVGLLRKQVFKNKDKKYLPFIEKIDVQTDRLLHLTSILLDVSKIGCGKFLMDKKVFNLSVEIFGLIKQIIKAETKREIIFNANYKGEIYGDKDKLTQVVASLLTNAIKYSPSEKNIILSVSKNKNSVSVSVRDYGLGISKIKQKRIFDRFYRNPEGKNDTYPGLGLGLYISAEIVKAHGGKIWVDSKAGEGSEFTFSIPIQ